MPSFDRLYGEGELMHFMTLGILISFPYPSCPFSILPLVDVFKFAGSTKDYRIHRHLLHDNPTDPEAAENERLCPNQVQATAG